MVERSRAVAATPSPPDAFLTTLACCKHPWSYVVGEKCGLDSVLRNKAEPLPDEVQSQQMR